MKIVFMVAGIGKRMGELVRDKPKCLLEIGGKPLLESLLGKFVANGVREIVLLVGYKKEMIVDFVKERFGDEINLTIVDNDKYDVYNNMYTVWCARDLLKGEPFILCNGDAIISKPIAKKLIEFPQSGIMLDMVNKNKTINSPKTIVENNRIFDLGRHLPPENNGGYAMGMYKFNAELSSAFFDEIGRMLSERKFQAGFHDPLITLFKKFEISPISTEGLSWTDLDNPEDFPYIEEVLQKIRNEESNELS